MNGDCEHRDVEWDPHPLALRPDVDTTVHWLRCTACRVSTAVVDHRALPAL